MNIALFGRKFDKRFDPYIQHLIDKVVETTGSTLVYAPFLEFLRERLELSDKV